MKNTIPTLALVSSFCLGVAVTPAADPNAEQPDNKSLAETVEQTVHVALEKAGQAKEQVARQVERAMQLAQSTIELAEAGEAVEVAEPLNVPMAFDDGLSLAFSPPRNSSPPLIVRSSDAEAGTLSNIQEDLTVMSRILNKAVEREVGKEGRDAAMGIVLSALPGSRRPQSIYLEGYGALFLVNVKFPLVPSPAKDEEKAEKPSDTTWEQTKRELYGQKPVRIWSLPGAETGAEYNAEQVEGLKKALLESLKNAANLRDVKSDESITIAVIGGRATGAGTRVKHITSHTGNNARKAEVYAVTEGGHGAVRESTMTLRVKKSDVESFAKGALDFEQFKKRVSVSTY